MKNQFPMFPKATVGWRICISLAFMGTVILACGLSSESTPSVSVNSKVAEIVTTMIKKDCGANLADLGQAECSEIKIKETYSAPPQDKADELNRQDNQVEEVWCASVSFLKKGQGGYSEIETQVALVNVGGDWYGKGLDKFYISTNETPHIGTCEEFTRFPVDVLEEQGGIGYGFTGNIYDVALWRGTFLVEERQGNPLIGEWKLLQPPLFTMYLACMDFPESLYFYNSTYSDSSSFGQSGKYQVSGNTLALLDTGREYTFSISGDVLTLTLGECAPVQYQNASGVGSAPQQTTAQPVQEETQVPSSTLSAVNLNVVNCVGMGVCPGATWVFDIVKSQSTSGPGTKEYSVAISADTQLLITDVWCATTQELLDDNLRNATWVLEINEVDYVQNVSAEDFVSEKGLYCQWMAVAIDGWAAQQTHTVLIGRIHSEDYYNGQVQFPAGEYLNQFIIDVD